MNQFDLLLILGIFLSSSMGFISGYLACYILKKDEKVIFITPDGKYSPSGKVTEKVEFPKQEIPTDPIVERMSQKDDVINHDGVGIVYRPTEEEVAKMNEAQDIKDAKEAVAETLRQEVPPEI